jgi:hypothetical protein
MVVDPSALTDSTAFCPAFGLSPVPISGDEDQGQEQGRSDI